MLQLEVAGTIIQLEDNEAAVIVYCNSSYGGKTLKIWSTTTDGTRDNVPEMLAQVISRKVGEEIVYAAVFPRFEPIDEYWYKKGKRSIKTRLWYQRRDKDASFILDSSAIKFLDKDITVFIGNVTEIDLTNEIWIKSSWD